eukprot:SM000251S08804  [mRNA]  locus=s251:71536:72519:+ [translate_table: standard]
MIGLLGTSLWSAYLGWQWRRVRTIPSEVAELKKQMPAPVEGAPPSEIEQKINKLTEERKTLVKGNFRDRHWNVGSLLLGGGVTMSIGGAVNTYLRTGKLFPGPHLFAGAGITALWAAAASLVPAMQKGDDNARNAHIALNVVNIGLFLWQVPTGFEIVEKVFQFAPWP